MRLGKRLKVLLFPGVLFEEMGFAYFGPVGLLAGPLIVSFFMAVVSMWKAELGDRRSVVRVDPTESPAPLV